MSPFPRFQRDEPIVRPVFSVRRWYLAVDVVQKAPRADRTPREIRPHRDTSAESSCSYGYGDVEASDVAAPCISLPLFLPENEKTRGTLGGIMI